jgi:hypothetical protein
VITIRDVAGGDLVHAFRELQPHASSMSCEPMFEICSPESSRIFPPGAPREQLLDADLPRRVPGRTSLAAAPAIVPPVASTTTFGSSPSAATAVAEAKQSANAIDRLRRVRT